jgi:hypothetical protein
MKLWEYIIFKDLNKKLRSSRLINGKMLINVGLVKVE